MTMVVEFDFETRQERSIPLDSAARACAEGRFCWIDLDAGNDRDAAGNVMRSLGVDEPSIEQALAGSDDGRHDSFDNLVHITVTAADFDPSEGVLITTPVDILLGPTFLVSLHRGNPVFLDQVRRGYAADFQRFARSSGFLLYELWDHLIVSYKKTTRALGDQVRDLQRQIYGDADDAIFARVAAVSANLLAMRRVVLAAREVLSELCTRQSAVVTETTRPFLERLVGTVERVVADLTVERETVAETLNLSLAIVGHRTNQVVSRLTVISLVFLPLTFLCGVYGMNFKYLPELEWRHGYAMFWVTSIVVTGASLGVMKRLGWW